jgi:hypothetical protein
MNRREKGPERPAPVTGTPERPPNETPSPDDRVDEAVEESFPASDPPAIGGDRPFRRDDRRDRSI